MKPTLTQAVLRPRGHEQPVELLDGSRGRLFDEHVLAGLDRRDRDRRQGVVGGRDDHEVDIGGGDSVLPAFNGSRARGPRQFLRAVRHGVGADGERCAVEGRGTLAPDEAAADDGDARTRIQRSPHVKPRSFGTIRRSV